MIYFEGERRSDKDCFQMIRTGKIVKSVLSGVSFKERKKLNMQSKQIQFGINQKKDNQNKTGQLKLF